MLTSIEVQQQKERFETFMSKANLSKIGKRYIYFTLNDAEDGRYTAYCYILRVLSLLAKVGGCYYCPATNHFYNEILKIQSMNSYIDSLPKANKS